MQIFLIINQLRQHGEVFTLPKSLFFNVDASLRKQNVLREWVTRTIQESEELLGSAEEKLEIINVMKKEGQALQSLGENVL